MQTDNEKYNETVQPNTAFLNELKAKLPEFFTKEGSFDLDKFRNQLKDKNVNELSEGYHITQDRMTLLIRILLSIAMLNLKTCLASTMINWQD